MKFYEWIANVCDLMCKPRSYGVELIKDNNCFFCFDDGMTPEEVLEKEKIVLILKN
jgi:hypothetical protein